MVQLTIDGQPVEVQEGTTVLEAANKLGIPIPHLCHHPALKPFGSCRVCLVEIQGMRTLQPSCTLPAAPNMVVQTATKAVIDARKFVLSLIFSERNHFCPFCQQTGGDCELQNTALAHEMTHWPIAPSWKVFPVDASHPEVLIDHNRCILCRRCVRACGDLVGMSTLGFEERGSESMLMADLGVPLGESSCIGCGACIQVCPTGTLVNRRAAYQGRDYTAEKVDSICTGCGIGCGITLLVRDNRIIRIDGDYQAEVNGGVLCRFGRFTQLDDLDRVTKPMIRKDGKLVEVSLEEALSAAAAGLQGAGAQVALSPRVSLESLALAEQIAGNLGGKVTSLPATQIEQVPPFLGEAITAQVGENGNLSKEPPNEITWATPYRVHAGANSAAFEKKSISGFAASAGPKLVVSVDDRAEKPDLGAGFVVQVCSFMDRVAENSAVVLPAALWAEQTGHYLNLTGKIQSTSRGLIPESDVLSAEEWLILLAGKLGFTAEPNWQASLQVAA